MGDAVKYAVVRVQGEQRMIDLFTLLVNNGYSDVSFVSSLAHTILKTENGTTQDDASTSRVSSSSTAAATSTAANTAATAVSSSGQQQQQPVHHHHPPQTTPTTTPQRGRTPKGSGSEQDSSFSSPPSNTAADLLQSLFERNAEEDSNHHFAGVHQQWVLPNGEIPSAASGSGGPPMMAMPGMMPAVAGGSSGFGGHDYGSGGLGGANSATQPISARSLRYNGADGTGRKVPYMVRMKGWQRKMLSDAMTTGTFPTGNELTELCACCQVTELQAIRFFRKRKFGQTGDASYMMEDDGDGMPPGSPDALMYQEPKMED